MEEFVEASDGLSPFFDLDTYVDAERKRSPNLFEDTRCQRLAELEQFFQPGRFTISSII